MKNPIGLRIGGVLLVLVGLLALLQNFGWLSPAWDVLWALFFAAGGAAFLAVFVTDRRRWWALFPGFPLLGLAGVILLSAISPALGEWGGALFLASLAAAFFVVYLADAKNWWAMIPAGVLLTLSGVTVLAAVRLDSAIPGVFFLGLAATFAVLYFLPAPEKRQTWPLIPAAVLGVMGLLTLAFVSSIGKVFWPLALLAAGGWMLYRAFRQPRAQG